LVLAAGITEHDLANPSLCLARVEAKQSPFDLKDVRLLKEPLHLIRRDGRHIRWLRRVPTPSLLLPTVEYSNVPRQ
jgi:hypothetical protein